MPKRQRLILLAVAALILVAAAVVLGAGGSSSAKESGPVTVVVRDAKPVGGVKVVTVKSGGTIDLTVRSDTADEIHFHGYDVHKNVAKGGSVHFVIPARIQGAFIVELEDHAETIANVDVVP